MPRKKRTPLKALAALKRKREEYTVVTSIPTQNELPAPAKRLCKQATAEVPASSSSDPGSGVKMDTCRLCHKMRKTKHTAVYSFRSVAPKVVLEECVCVPCFVRMALMQHMECYDRFDDSEVMVYETWEIMQYYILRHVDRR